METLPTEAPPATPLLSLVADDPETIVALRPREIGSDEGLRALVEAIAPPEWIASFEARWAFELARLDEAVLVTYPGDGSTLWLLRGEALEAVTVVEHVGRRMDRVVLRSETRRVGPLGGAATYDVVALDARTLVVGRNAGPVVARLLDRARGEPEGSPALPGPLAPALDDSTPPVQVLVPHPLQLPPDTGLGLLLARNAGLLLRVRGSTTTSSPTVPLELDLVGELPPGADENLRTWLETLGQTALGRMIGMGEALGALTVSIRAHGATIRASLPLDALRRAFRVLFLGEIAELLDLSEREPSSAQLPENNEEISPGTD